uniref:Papaverine 7-O-demethylase n=1 Tax=Papaver somniferum TaxID=3469 RepID=A0A0K0YGU2_PAPSO|nr:papaverine 7-O-demethylase [Papaver somniferum]
MEKAKLMKLGNGLSIPSVQELAELTFAEVPSRYVCTNDENLLLMTMGASEIDDETVPVIDLQNLLSPEPAIGKSELDWLHYSCKEWGFFQLVNHGVDALLVDHVKSEIHSFFNLPLNEKTKYGQRDGDVEGFGQAFLVSENQKLDWADMFFINTLPLHLRKPHLFPNLPLPLRETIESYSSEMKKLSMVLFEMMGKAIEVIDIKEAITEMFEDGMQSMRMNYYPPCPQPERVIGITPHSDFDGLTILLQLNEVEGLQIRKEDKWISIKPLPDAFIVNVGDIWEIMTNGVHRSVDHRGVINSTKERLSIATFHSPKLELEIGPISSLIRPETPAVFKSAGRFEDLLKEGLSRKLDGKSFLDCMRM